MTEAQAPNLTVREKEVLELVLRGHRNGAIADKLGLSTSTIKWHMHSIYKKTKTETREQLLAHRIAVLERRLAELGCPTS